MTGRLAAPAHTRGVQTSAADTLQRERVGEGPRPRPRAPETARSVHAPSRANRRQATSAPRSAAHPGEAGRPLPDAVRSRLAPIVGSRAATEARVHTDAAANARAAAAKARALASGNDIFFAPGQYRPGTREGDRLIAHEVTHVDQAQRGLLRRPAFKAAAYVEPTPLETAADGAADRLGKETTDKAGNDQYGRPGSPAVPAPGRTPALPTADGTPAAVAAKVAEQEPDGDQATAPQEPGAARAAPVLPADMPLMPEPVVELSPVEKKRITGVQHRAAATSRATATAPVATENVATTKAAVQVPQAESDAHAAEEVVADLSKKEKPSLEIVALCDRIRTLILKKRPADEEGVIDTRPAAVATEAGAGVAGGVQKNVDGAKASYGSIDATPQGPAPATPPGIEPIPPAAPSAPLSTGTATPDAVPAENVSLDQDNQKMAAKAEEAGLGGDAAKLVNSGPVAEARDAHAELTTLAKDGVAEAIRAQQAALTTSDTDMAALQAKALASLKEARAGHTSGVTAEQNQAKSGNEDLHTRLSNRAKVIFTGAQSKVQPLLENVPKTAMARWEAALPPLTRAFDADLKVVKDKVDERHSGIGGFFVAGWDAATGLPGWVSDAYDAAEKNFGDGVCTLITGISSYVNGIIKIADEIISTSRSDIHDIFTKGLPQEEQAWAAEQLKSFDKKLDTLHEQAESTRTAFNKELMENAGGAVQAAREKIQQLRKEAQGVWGRFLDAVGRFLDDPVKFIIEGLLEILGISPPAFWAVVEKVKKFVSDIVDAPLKFANNLMSGISDGFGLFFKNIGKHLIEGLLEWLLSGLKAEGITIEVPKELSLKNVVVFCLQLLGISWMRIRKLLVVELGEKAVAVIEKTAGAIYSLATKGLDGIFEDVKKLMDPKTIIDTIVDAAIRFISETLIVKVAQKIIMMLNPAGAILAALEAIYRVLKWIFHNAAKIFHLIEAVVNGMVDVLSGNVAGVAKTVEKALAMLVSPVIDFLADYLGLGGLPGKVATSVKGLQTWVEGILRSVIKWLVAMGKRILAALGFKGKEDKDAKSGGDIGVTLTFKEGNQTHHLYVDVKGSSATVMVSSTPMTVSAWLDHLQSKVTGQGETETPQGARALLQRARDQLLATDSVADQDAASKASAQATGSANSPQFGAVDDKERELRDTLDELGELFGEKPLLVEGLQVQGAPAALTTISTEFGHEIIGYRAPKTLVNRSTGSGYVAKLLKTQTAKARLDAKTGILHLTLTTVGDLATAASGTSSGRLIADDTGVARVTLTKDDADFAITGSIDDVGAEIAHGPLPLLAWSAVEEGGAKRLAVLAGAWTADARGSRLRESNPDGKKIYLWRPDFTAEPETVGRQYLEEKYKARAIEAQTSTQFNKLLEERKGVFKKAFQTAAGEEAAKQARDFGLNRATRDRIIRAVQTVRFENNETYGALVMPQVEPEPLPPKVREALVAALENPAPALDASNPTALRITLPQEAQLRAILEEALTAARLSDPPNRDLIDSLTWWKNHVVQPEMHHVTPEWLGGPAKPTVELYVPRILHNFGEGPTDPGFHQVLNGILKGRLGFAEAGSGSDNTPRINGERSARIWLDQSPSNPGRLRKALAEAYADWTGARAPGLLHAVEQQLSIDFKKYEQAGAGSG